MIKPEELKVLYDQSQAYAKGYADGAASVLQTLATKLAEEEKKKQKTTNEFKITRVVIAISINDYGSNNLKTI